MKKLSIFLLLFSVGIAALSIFRSTPKPKQTILSTSTETRLALSTATSSAIMSISLPDVVGGMIPKKYTCDGENVNPTIKLVNIPQAAQSLIVLVDDPDAPSGDFIHWLLFNVDPKTAEIATNSVPVGASQGINSARKSYYTGPCPPSGTHHYVFTVYVLTQPVSIDNKIGKSDLEQQLHTFLIQKAEGTAQYSR